MPTNNNHKTVVLVSQPGIMHNVLRNFLRSLPLTAVFDADGCLSAYGYIENNHVDVVIMDTNSPLTEKLALLTRIKTYSPHIQCVVLTMTTRNHERINAAGADHVFLQDKSLDDIERAILAL